MILTPRRTIFRPPLYYPPCPIPLRRPALADLLRSPGLRQRQRGLVSPFGCGFQAVASNVTSPANNGTTITPGANDALGSYAEFLSDTVLTDDVYGLLLYFRDGGVTNNARPTLVNIGADPAGGTSYSDIISNLNAASSGQQHPGSLCYYFPLYIKAGTALAARARVGNASAGTFVVSARAFMKPTRAELLRVGAYVDSIGADTANSRGTIITPGTSSAEGSYVSLGTLPRPAWWFQLGMSVDDNSMSFGNQTVDLAYDATTKVLLIENAQYNTQSTENLSGELTHGAARDLPSGTELFARIANSQATNDSNFSVVAHALGG